MNNQLQKILQLASETKEKADELRELAQMTRTNIKLGTKLTKFNRKDWFRDNDPNKIYE